MTDKIDVDLDFGFEDMEEEEPEVAPVAKVQEAPVNGDATSLK
jgi:hypothetical protein